MRYTFSQIFLGVLSHDYIVYAHLKKLRVFIFLCLGAAYWYHQISCLAPQNVGG